VAALAGIQVRSRRKLSIVVILVAIGATLKLDLEECVFAFWDMTLGALDASAPALHYDGFQQLRNREHRGRRSATKERAFIEFNRARPRDRTKNGRSRQAGIYDKVAAGAGHRGSWPANLDYGSATADEAAPVISLARRRSTAAERSIIAAV